LADVSAKILTQFVDNLEQTVLVDDSITAPAAEAPAASDSPAASSSQEAPTIRKIDQPEPEAINLLEQAGSPVLKRAVPILGVAIGALVVYGLIRRRRK
jgi:hypothetical protein